MEQLRLIDYINQPLSSLVNHPDYDQDAFSVVSKLLYMTTAQLINLNLGGQNG